MTRRCFAWMLALAALLTFVQEAKAWHIAGAQLRYDCLGQAENGDYRYRIYLTLFRDCSVDDDPSIPNAAPFDNEIHLFFFGTDDRRRVRLRDVPQPADTPRVEPNELLACIAIPPSVCLQEGVYETEINLPARLQGYDVAWARCCRNQNVKNLVLSRDQGVTFLAHIPGSESHPCNNMSRFRERPPLFICKGVETIIDFSAEDVDGDSLFYRLTHPFNSINQELEGATQNDPTVGPIGNRFNNLGAPPYQNVRFARTYNTELPFGENSPCAIDPRTGLLTVTPAEEGLYVLAVSVFEYRNGVLLAENKFDLQIQVIPCQPKGSPPRLAHLLAENQQQGAQVVGDTLYVDIDEKPCFRFRATDADRDAQLVFRFESDSVTGMRVSTNGTNPKYFEVCLDDLCAYAGMLLAFPLEVIDSTLCPVMFRARDTAYVRVRRPPVYRPIMQARPDGSPDREADTLVIDFGDRICFDVQLTSDGGNPDRLDFSWRMQPSVPGESVTVNVERNASGLIARFCWTADCAGVERPMLLELTGAYNNICAANQYTYQLFYVRVRQPTQPRQVIQNLIDRADHVYDGDTLLIQAFDSLCYSLSVNDGIPWHGTSVTSWMEAKDGSRLGQTIRQTVREYPPKPEDVDYVRVLEADLCWTAACERFGEALRIVARVDDHAQCAIEWTDYDTVWVRVIQPDNLAPMLETELVLPENVANVDDFEVVAETQACVAFDLTDPAQDGDLSFRVAILDSAGSEIDGALFSIEFNRQEVHRISGTVCFTPSCDLLYQRLTLRFTGIDSSLCTEEHTIDRFFTFRVIERPTFDPALLIDFASLPHDGDTVVFYPRMTGCIGVRLLDTLNTGHQNELQLAAEGIPFTTEVREAASLRPSDGVDSIAARLCWRPTCAELGRVFPVLLTGTTNPGCAAPRSVQGHFWIRVAEAPNLPPVVTLDDREIPDTLMPGERYCITATVSDPDSVSMLFSRAIGPTAERDYGYGSGIEVERLGHEPDRFRICFTPNCHLKHQTYTVRFCADDTTNCTEALQDCEEVSYPIQDCGLAMPNVFTPNGDGFNDSFGPLLLEGVQQYEMHVYDRWGRLMFHGRKPDRWNGLSEGKEAEAGVYFYRLRYERESGSGPMLKSEQTGKVTLLR